MSESGVPAKASNDSGSLWLSLRHDIRTPFNQIIGYCELLREDSQSGNNVGVLHALDEIQTSAREALDRVLSFFSLTRADEIARDQKALQRDLIRFVGLTLAVLKRAHAHASLHQPDMLSDLHRIEAATLQLEALADLLGTNNLAISSGDIPARSSFPKTEHAHALSSAPGVAPVSGIGGRILIVDDHEANRALMGRYLEQNGIDFGLAGSGREALEILAAGSFDLVLLDMRMPEMDGFAVLKEMKADGSLRNIPVIVVSALDEIESVAAAIELGAADYLTKPFNQVLLRARLRVLLERKRMEDERCRRTAELEQALAEVEKQKKLADGLILNILPQKIATELQSEGSVSPMYFEDATILIADFVGFTLSTETLSAEELVHVLDEYFTAFDHIVDRYGLEKLKTVGDSYIMLGGLPERSPSHPVDVVLAALEMVEIVEELYGKTVNWKVRIGIHTGPLIAGVVGIRKFAFDVWGDSINYCSRVESSGAPNQINISDRTFARVKDFFECSHRGKILTKDQREADMYFVHGLAPTLAASNSLSPAAAFQRRYRTYFQKTLSSFPKKMVGAK